MSQVAQITDLRNFFSKTQSGTRVPFKNLIDYLEGGHSLTEFPASFPRSLMKWLSNRWKMQKSNALTISPRRNPRRHRRDLMFHRAILILERRHLPHAVIKYSRSLP